jgi:hypothetical protein
MRLQLMRLAEEQSMDAVCENSEFRPADAVVIKALSVKFSADSPWVRRQHENSRTDDDRFLDRVCHEEDREPQLVPQ